MIDASWNYLPGGDAGITGTVHKIKQAIYHALRDPEQRIRRRAESVLRLYMTPEQKDQTIIAHLFQWFKDHFRYTPDPAALEYVKSPEVIDKEVSDYGTFMGDCDDGTAYLAALLQSIGFRTRAVVMTDIKAPHNNFHHIYLQVWSPRLGSWVSLDSTARFRPAGWSPKAKRVRYYDL